MKRCPKCGAEIFYVTAHVTQDWKVNRFGDFVEIVDDCIEVTHYPDDADIWGCANCNYEDKGDKFNVEEEIE